MAGLMRSGRGSQPRPATLLELAEGSTGQPLGPSVDDDTGNAGLGPSVGDDDVTLGPSVGDDLTVRPSLGLGPSVGDDQPA